MVNHQLLEAVNQSFDLAGTGFSYPNPFSTETTIPLQLEQRSHVLLEILDANGRKIKTLISKELEAGTITFKWDGTNSQGRKLPGGMYFYRLNTGKESVTRRLILSD